MIAWLRWLVGLDHNDVSETWLAQQEIAEARKGDECNVIRQWPISKIVNESGWFNAQTLRKRA